MSRALAALALLFAGACARPVTPAGRAPVSSDDPFAGWDSAPAVAIADGVVHTSARTSAGPWAVQVLAIDLRRCAPLIRARKPGPPLSARATPSALAGDALAAINADFFMLPGGTPVGPHVQGGEVLAGPGRRTAFLLTGRGPAADAGRITGFAAVRTDSAAIGQVNRPLAGDAQHEATASLVLYTAWHGDTIHATPDRPAARLRPVRDGVAIIAALDTAAIAAGGPALRAGPAAADWLRRRAPGDTVVWQVSLVAADGDPVREAVGGFPVLVLAGRNVVAEQTGIAASFGPARHPRTAVGWNDTAMWWVVVDGRQPGWSDGMSLDELARLMLDLGATEAVNLDGGGSTAMVVRGTVANRPSDAQGERAVGNALLLQECTPPGATKEPREP